MTTASQPLRVSSVNAVTDLDHCYAIRMAVFVEEQGVPPELELDAYDSQATHYLARLGDEPIATARVIEKHGAAKIGRVAVLKAYRGRGYGRDLMIYLLQDAAACGFSEAVLDAQTYALAFYERLGFLAEGDEFLDAGIPHFRMRRSLSSL